MKQTRAASAVNTQPTRVYLPQFFSNQGRQSNPNIKRNQYGNIHTQINPGRTKLNRDLSAYSRNSNLKVGQYFTAEIRHSDFAQFSNLKQSRTLKQLKPNLVVLQLQKLHNKTIRSDQKFAVDVHNQTINSSIRGHASAESLSNQFQHIHNNLQPYLDSKTQNQKSYTSLGNKHQAETKKKVAFESKQPCKRGKYNNRVVTALSRQAKKGDEYANLKGIIVAKKLAVPDRSTVVAKQGNEMKSQQYSNAHASLEDTSSHSDLYLDGPLSKYCKPMNPFV